MIRSGISQVKNNIVPAFLGYFFRERSKKTPCSQVMIQGVKEILRDFLEKLSAFLIKLRP
jgi:hypothetical protein